jgi:hypothetical protein
MGKHIDESEMRRGRSAIAGLWQLAARSSQLAASQVHSAPCTEARWVKWEEPEERDGMALALATVASCEDGLDVHRVCSRGS